MLASVVHKDAQSYIGVVNHGVDGWVLVDMEWSPESGLASYDFVQFDERGAYIASACAIVRQPFAPTHEGWAELWNKPEVVFGLRPTDPKAPFGALQPEI